MNETVLFVACPICGQRQMPIDGQESEFEHGLYSFQCNCGCQWLQDLGEQNIVGERDLRD